MPGQTGRHFHAWPVGSCTTSQNNPTGNPGAARNVDPRIERKPRSIAMAKCDTCGNDYDKAFKVTKAGKAYTFDSFECAIHLLAPACAACGGRVIGHGLEHNGTIYCCAHCAGRQGVEQLRDRV